MDVYESISELNVNLSPEVVDFFDSYITADVDVNVKANNEKLQRINDVNDKVKEIKNTLYQNKDIVNLILTCIYFSLLQRDNKK